MVRLYYGDSHRPLGGYPAEGWVILLNANWYKLHLPAGTRRTVLTT
jgi:hypothetical protein